MTAVLYKPAKVDEPVSNRREANDGVLSRQAETQFEISLNNRFRRNFITVSKRDVPAELFSRFAQSDAPRTTS